jgi:hypothetical protein
MDLTTPKQPQTQNLNPISLTIFKNILAAVKRAYSNISEDGQINKASFPITPMAMSLHYTCLDHVKGVSFIYRQIIYRKDVKKKSLLHLRITHGQTSYNII